MKKIIDILKKRWFLYLVLWILFISGCSLIAYENPNSNPRPDNRERVGVWNSVNSENGIIKILDITGDRGNSFEPAIQSVTFLVTVWCGNPGINIAELHIHWLGPSRNIILGLNTSSPTATSASAFASDRVPVMAPRTMEWDPNATPPAFFLVIDTVAYIKINLGPINGINDPLSPGKTANVYFEVEGLPGTVHMETFTAPNSFGTNRYIDFTMQ